MEKILYLEDDLSYAKRLTESITSFDFEIINTIEELQEIEDFSQYSMLLSDLYVYDDFDKKILEIIKNIEIPVAIISNTEKLEDELLVFNNSINEFITKSSLFEVIEYRLNNLIEKETNISISYQNKGNKYYLIDESNIVTDKGYDVKMLSGREFRILKYLLKNKGEAVSREEIYLELYSKKLVDSERRVVDVYINMLRNKLDLEQIKSVRGVGYKWEDEIQ